MSTVRTERPAAGARVDVYFNLHKKVFSVRRSGRVVLHTPAVILKNARFYVGEKGRQQVIATGHKNVHAGVRGAFHSTDQVDVSNYRRASYNPYRAGHFYDKDSGDRVDRAEEVVLIDKKIFYK